MADNYTIYLVNQSASNALFWCFLSQPTELAGQPEVFANSAASLEVAPNDPGLNSFTIPMQYVVGAGASNNAVGLGVQITSTVTQDANLGDQFLAVYADAPPNMGPTLTSTGTEAGPGQISISSNSFNQVNNEEAGWYSNMSFGVNTAGGFVGMTWSPSPSQTMTLTPNLNFYVAVGSYQTNTLADFTAISNSSAALTATSFSLNEATVTYTSTGEWIITPGQPPSLLAGAIGSLVDAQRSLDQAHSDLITLVQKRAVQSRYLLTGPSEEDTVVSVQWAASPAEHVEVAPGLNFLSGTLTVGQALTAGFTIFVLSGVTFQVSSAPVGGTTVRFTYSGSQSTAAIKSLFTAGARLLFLRQ